jgi:hypothetical protein
MKRRLSGDRPGYLIDGVNCPTLRRAKNGTFRYHVNRQTGERGSIMKTPDSHVSEAEEYGAAETGHSTARKRSTERQAAREADRQKRRQAPPPRYSPLSRRIL